MEAISNTLFWISNGLLIPVVVLLLVFLLYSVVLAGGFFVEYSRRHRQQGRTQKAIESLTAGNVVERLSPLATGGSPFSRCLGKMLERGGEPAYCELLLSDYEVEAERELSRPRMLVKLGPMLGLMGTLIPMGPALVGLANGDLSSMAYNMQVAFATTVVGMCIAAVGVVTSQARQRWYAKDINSLNYINEVLQTPAGETSEEAK